MRLKQRTIGIDPSDDVELCALAAQHDYELAEVIRKVIRHGLRAARENPASVFLNQGLPGGAS